MGALIRLIPRLPRLGRQIFQVLGIGTAAIAIDDTAKKFKMPTLPGADPQNNNNIIVWAFLGLLAILLFRK